LGARAEERGQSGAGNHVSPAAIVWGPGLTTIYNDAFRPILGQKPQALGRSFADIWAEAWEEIGPIAARAMAGEATYIEDFPLLIDRSGRMEQAWFTFCYSPLRLADGTVAAMMDTVMETTTTVRARTELRTLNHELGHRLKNTLATVQSHRRPDPARRFGTGCGERPFRAAGALGQAHDVLLKRNWTGGYVLQVAEAALSSFGGPGQTRISGAGRGDRAEGDDGAFHGAARTGHQRREVWRPLHEDG
jgi:hypothetical protein